MSESVTLYRVYKSAFQNEGRPIVAQAEAVEQKTRYKIVGNVGLEFSCRNLVPFDKMESMRIGLSPSEAIRLYRAKLRKRYDSLAANLDTVRDDLAEAMAMEPS